MEKKRLIVDREMRKVCLLGILRKGLSSYSSPIMLKSRKMSGILHALLQILDILTQDM